MPIIQAGMSKSEHHLWASWSFRFSSFLDDWLYLRVFLHRLYINNSFHFHSRARDILTFKRRASFKSQHLICLDFFVRNIDRLFISILYRWAEWSLVGSLGKQTIGWHCERWIWSERSQWQCSNRTLWGWRWQWIQGRNQNCYTQRCSLSAALESAAENALFTCRTCQHFMIESVISVDVRSMIIKQCCTAAYDGKQ